MSNLLTGFHNPEENKSQRVQKRELHLCIYLGEIMKSEKQKTLFTPRNKIVDRCDYLRTCQMTYMKLKASEKKKITFRLSMKTSYLIKTRIILDRFGRSLHYNYFLFSFFWCKL